MLAPGNSYSVQMDEAGRAVHAKLSTSLAAVHDVLLRSTGQVANKSVHDFVVDESFLGPVLVACGLTDGKGGMHALPELSYGGWPADGGGVAVGIRSLSKMVAAATMLVEPNPNVVTLTLTLTLARSLPPPTLCWSSAARAGTCLGSICVQP